MYLKLKEPDGCLPVSDTIWKEEQLTVLYNHKKKNKTKKTRQQGNTMKHTHTKINILYLHVCRISFIWGKCSHDGKKNFNQCHHKNYGNNGKVATILYWLIMCHYGIPNDTRTIQDHNKSAQEGAEDVQRSVGNSLERQKRNTTNLLERK